MRININAEEKELDVIAELSYSLAVALAGFKDDERVYTVTYECKSRQGFINRGSKVELEEGMIINVANTSGA